MKPLEKKVKYKIVQFNDGTYGIMRKKFLESSQFLSNQTSEHSSSSWCAEAFAYKYCRFDTVMMAIKAFRKKVPSYRILYDISNTVPHPSDLMSPAEAAIDEELVTIGQTIESYKTPEEAIRALIDWNVELAKDMLAWKEKE